MTETHEEPIRRVHWHLVGIFASTVVALVSATVAEMAVVAGWVAMAGLPSGPLPRDVIRAAGAVSGGIFILALRWSQPRLRGWLGLATQEEESGGIKRCARCGTEHPERARVCVRCCGPEGDASAFEEDWPWEVIG